MTRPLGLRVTSKGRVHCRFSFRECLHPACNRLMPNRVHKTKAVLRIHRDGSSPDSSKRLESACVAQLLTNLFSCLHHTAKPLVSIFCSCKKPPPIAACFRARASSPIGLEARACQKGASVIDVGTARYAGPDLARCDLCGELQLSGGSWWHHWVLLQLSALPSPSLALPGLRQAFLKAEPGHFGPGSSSGLHPATSHPRTGTFPNGHSRPVTASHCMLVATRRGPRAVTSTPRSGDSQTDTKGCSGPAPAMHTEHHSMSSCTRALRERLRQAEKAHCNRQLHRSCKTPPSIPLEKTGSEATPKLPDAGFRLGSDFGLRKAWARTRRLPSAIKASSLKAPPRLL